jgi:hypothetical protein
MIRLCVVFLILLSFSSYADTSIKQIRLLYDKANSDEKSCLELLKRIEERNKNLPIFLGYKAAGTMMKAKYGINPIQKLNRFKEGKTLLDKTISNNQNNIELRYLRFANQTNAPSFLGYNNYIKRDKEFILTNLSKTKDKELINIISKFLLQSDHLNDQEKKEVQQWKNY